MFSKIRSFFLSLTIIAVLLFSAIGTTTAYADDDDTTETAVTQTSGGDSSKEDEEQTPDAEPSATVKPVVSSDEEATSTDAAGDGTPKETTPDAEPTATTEPVVSSDEEATSTDPAADGTPKTNTQTATTEPVVTVDQGTDTPSSSAEESTTDTAAADTSILEQVPENTAVAVLNSDGQAQPLATAEAADAIAVASDPIWCPATQTTPTPGANGCTPSFTSFTDLLNELSNNPTTYQGAGIIYVQQGQYNGGESVIDFNSFNLSNISNSNLLVQGGWNTTTNVVDQNSTSNFNVPIIIGSSTNPWGGSLTIDNIVVSDTSGTGLTIHTNGNVTISDSSFQRNRDSGAVVRAGGNVAIQNSHFDNPGTNRLQRTGLDIDSAGSVSLLDVIADGNREVGAVIVADGRVSIGASFIGGTSFSGMKSTTTTSCPGSPSQFCGFGLQVTTPDSIDLQGVVGNDNFLWGANLHAGQDVNIVDSIFNANSTGVPTFIDDTGLFVTAGGSVSLNNVTANDNRLYGASIDAVGDVSVNNSNFLNNNGVTVSGSGANHYDGIGLQVNSDGAIFINNTNASGNSLFGANLTAAGDVAIANSIFSNTTTNDATAPLGVGLSIVSGQNVFIDTVTLDGNQANGATIQATADVFLDFVTATNNGTNGVEVDAACTHLNGGTFSGNGQYGLSLVNPALDLVTPPVFSGNGLGDIFPAAPGACPVAVSGGNTGGSTASQSQSASLATTMYINTSMYKGSGLINRGAITLDNLFAGSYQVLGVSTSSSGKVTTLGIFTGKYAYIHSAKGLQIVFLSQPAIYSGVWSSNS